MKKNLNSLLILFLMSLFFESITARAGEFFSDLYEVSPLNTKKLFSAPEVNAGKTKCLSKLPASTRKMLFDFYYSSALENPTVAKESLAKFSKICGMIYKESSGNPVACSDMNYNGSHKAVVAFCKNDSLASVSMYEKLRDDKTIKRDHQTNFGLLQISADILTWNPKLRPIFEKVVKEVSAHPENALTICGSKCMFSDCGKDLLEKMKKYSGCKLNYKKVYNSVAKETKPEITAEEINCFDHWVSFCPNLNIALGLHLPPAYFESRAAPSLCEDELSLVLSSALIKKNDIKSKPLKCLENEN